MPARKADKTSKPEDGKAIEHAAARGVVAATLPEAKTGKASPAKPADCGVP